MTTEVQDCNPSPKLVRSKTEKSFTSSGLESLQNTTVGDDQISINVENDLISTSTVVFGDTKFVANKDRAFSKYFENQCQQASDESSGISEKGKLSGERLMSNDRISNEKSVKIESLSRKNSSNDTKANDKSVEDQILQTFSGIKVNSFKQAKSDETKTTSESSVGEGSVNTPNLTRKDINTPNVTPKDPSLNTPNMTRKDINTPNTTPKDLNTPKLARKESVNTPTTPNLTRKDIINPNLTPKEGVNTSNMTRKDIINPNLNRKDPIADLASRKSSFECEGRRMECIKLAMHGIGSPGEQFKTSLVTMLQSRLNEVRLFVILFVQVNFLIMHMGFLLI